MVKINNMPSDIKNDNKLPNELLQMLNDTLFQNSLNFSDLNKIY